MKTLIVYATKYGFTADCVEQLKTKLKGHTEAVNIAKGTMPALSDFDNVIIGGSIYIGKVNKKLTEFCANNLDTLLSKRVALFLCCGMAEDFDKSLAASFPEALRKNAVAAECFGGELNTEKMGFADKLITKQIKKMTAKENKPEPAPLPENIAKLAQAMNTL